MPEFITEVRDGIGVITTNNPEKRIALSEPMIREIIAAFGGFGEKRLPVLVLRVQGLRQPVYDSED